MSEVRHHRIDADIQVHSVPDYLFIVSMNNVIQGMLEIAEANEETVDWSTFRMEPGDKTEVVDARGARFFYEDPLHVSVDAIKIVRDE